jgi:hypothetical protein
VNGATGIILLATISAAIFAALDVVRHVVE